MTNTEHEANKKSAHLAIQTKQDDHDEEEDGPEGRQGHLRNGLGVGDEGETGSRLGHVTDVDALLVRHEAEHGEDDEAGEEARAAVGAGENHRIPAKVQKKHASALCTELAPTAATHYAEISSIR